jgi:hypothetical protein
MPQCPQFTPRASPVTRRLLFLVWKIAAYTLRPSSQGLKHALRQRRPQTSLKEERWLTPFHVMGSPHPLASMQPPASLFATPCWRPLVSCTVLRYMYDGIPSLSPLLRSRLSNPPPATPPHHPSQV